MDKKTIPQDKIKQIQRVSEVLKKGNVAILQYIDELEDRIKKVEENKTGGKGVQIQVNGEGASLHGKDGDNYVLTDDDKNEIAETISNSIDRRSIVQEVLKNLDYKGLVRETLKNVQVPTPKNGDTPTDAKLRSLIKPLIPSVDIDGIVFRASKQATANVSELIPDNVSNEDIRDSLEALRGEDRLDISAIKGLENYNEIVSLAKRPVQVQHTTGSTGLKGILPGTGYTVDNSILGYPKLTITGGGGAVSSVFTRTGAVTAQSGDYTTAQVTESGSLYFTNARAQSAISLTTTGTSGAATYSGGVLNIPAYAGTVSSISVTTANGISGTVANPTTTPALTLALAAITPTTVTATGLVQAPNFTAKGPNATVQVINTNDSLTNAGYFKLTYDSFQFGYIDTTNQLYIGKEFLGGNTVIATTQNFAVLGPSDLANVLDDGAGGASFKKVSKTRIVRRVVTTTQSATPTVNTDNTDVVSITGLAQAVTSFTTNLTGTPNDGDSIVYRITDNGTPRALSWGSSFEASTVALPVTTVISTLLTVVFEWNTVTSKWRCVGTA